MIYHVLPSKIMGDIIINEISILINPDIFNRGVLYENTYSENSKLSMFWGNL